MSLSANSRDPAALPSSSVPQPRELQGPAEVVTGDWTIHPTPGSMWDHRATESRLLLTQGHQEMFVWENKELSAPKPGSDQTETRTEPLCVLSLSLPRSARLSSAAKARNFPWRHPRREFIPDPCDVTRLQRPRGFCPSREALTCVGILLLADTGMSYKKFLPALPPAAFRIFPWEFFR